MTLPPPDQEILLMLEVRYATSMLSWNTGGMAMNVTET
jgi:hypothetical protein